MWRISPRTGPVVGALALMVGVSGWLFVGAPTFSALAGGGGAPRGHEAATPTPGPSGSHSELPPNSARSYFSPMALPAASIIHGVSTSYDWAESVPDPSNGSTVSSEFWIQIDSSGQPTNFVGRYSLGGEAFQTIVDDGRSMVVRRAETPVGDASLLSACRFESSSSPASLLKTLPQVVDPDQLKASAFTEQGTATLQPLPLVSAYTASPFSDISSGQVWRSTASTPAARTVTFDPKSGRLLRWQSVSINQAGVTTARHDELYGPLEVITGGVRIERIAGDVVAGGPCGE